MMETKDVINVRSRHIKLMRCYKCGEQVEKALIFKQANEVEMFQMRYLCFKCARMVISEA